MNIKPLYLDGTDPMSCMLSASVRIKRQYKGGQLPISISLCTKCTEAYAMLSFEQARELQAWLGEALSCIEAEETANDNA